jgi:CubicO group peptidase (beta-lactamase class C family)
MIARSPNRLLALILALLVGLCSIQLAPPAHAAAGLPLAFFDQPSVGWRSVRNMTAAAHQTYFDQQAANSSIMIDAERIEISGQLRVSSVWQRNTDGRGWASRSNLTDAQFDSYQKQYSAAGMRLIDQDAYTLDGAIRYAGIWMENKEGLDWVSHQGRPSAEFSDEFSRLSQQGLMLVDVESYVLADTRLYSSIWVENTGGLDWALRRDLTSAEYATLFDQYSKAGFRVLDLESYQPLSGPQRYAAIWVKHTGGRGWYAYRDMNARDFGNRWNQLRDAGYRLVDFEVYDTASGVRYAGIWRQNGSRPDWAYREQVDDLAADYVADTDIAGLGVAIAVGGQIVYLRGFGDADIAADKWFHSHTVARAASGCKAIAGVLGLELEEKGLIDLDSATRDGAPGLPAFHTHTLRQLISSRSGVRHYTSNDPTSNVQIQYDWQTTAAGLFSADPLAFAPGTDYLYSTHGYTLLGAALEGELGDPTAEILRDHLSVPHGLPSLRAENRSVPNANRAALYQGSAGGPQEVAADNISWKLLGGGCELSPFDYARFGAKLTGGSILSQASLDALWTAPDNSSNYALGWNTGTHLGERVVAKSGGQTGAASYIRIYPDRDIVVAIMSNQSGHSPRDLSLLISTLLVNAGVGAAVPAEVQAEGELSQVIIAPPAGELGEPEDELGEPELGVPLFSRQPPAQAVAVEPAEEPFVEAAATFMVHLPLIAR